MSRTGVTALDAGPGPLGVLVGGHGPEQDRIDRVTQHLMARTPSIVLHGSADPRLASCSALLVADPADLVVAPGFAPPIPMVTWMTRASIDDPVQWRKLAASAAVLAPHTEAARMAHSRGISRSRVHVIAHPRDPDPGPVLREAAVDGVVALVSPPEQRPALHRALSRSPLVRGIIDITDEPSNRHASIVAFADQSVTGHWITALMAAGAPIVAWDTAAASDAIVDGICGWLVRPTSMDAMSSTVHHVLRNRWARETAGIAARDRVAARHAPSTVAAAIAGIAMTVHRSSPRELELTGLTANVMGTDGSERAAEAPRLE